MLGRVYEFFLGKFAQAEGKRGGEFFTPGCVVRLLVEMLEPYEGRVYDPCCGSAGMFVQVRALCRSSRRAENQHLDLRAGIESDDLATRPYDLAFRGSRPTLARNRLTPSCVISTRTLKPTTSSRIRSSTTPIGRESCFRMTYAGATVPRRPATPNYAWIQHFIHHLAPPNGRGGGVAGFVMANGSLSSGSGGEGEIRQRIVEADLVDAIVALPPQLFLTTGIPACLWFLTPRQDWPQPEIRRP